MMLDKLLPRYPIYIPSKGRYQNCLTAKFLLKDGCPFYLVVEAPEADEYGSRFGYERLLILPWAGDDKKRRAYTKSLGIENGGLIAARNWIKAHATENGFLRHWQIDDNCRYIQRRYKGKRLYVDAGVALAAVEDFIDRYENVAIAGLNYVMFAPETAKMPPFILNHHVYSCTLLLNELPYKWRIRYNDDTDMCLQVLANGWCTVLFNAFLIFKLWTMKMSGGNTTDLYQGDGRLKMARSLERLWPGVVETDRRFQRPQHVVKDSWRRFDTPLKKKPGLMIDPTPNEYGMELVQVKPVKSEVLRKLLEEQQKAKGDQT